LVDRALAYEKNARWPDARSFQQAVREARPLAIGTVSASSPRPRSSEKPVDPTLVVPYAAISSHTLRSGTSSTNHPMRGDSRAGWTKTSRLWIIGGIPVALAAGAVIYALRGPPQPPPLAPTAATANLGSAPAPILDKRPLEPSGTDLQGQLVESPVINPAATHVGLKADKPPKPPKPVGKPTPHTPDPVTAHSATPTPPVASAGDLFDKRH
jgi:hypothetical protein